MIVKSRKINFYYNDLHVLKNVDLEVEKQDFVSIVGPSGCGKSTLLNLINGLNKSNDIEIELDNNDIAMVFQYDTLLEWKDVLSNILLPYSLKNNISDNVIKRANKLIEEFGLNGYKDYYPSQLSGGMKKRVELCRALIVEPKLLILDEPFSSLDILTRERLNVLVHNLHYDKKMTTIMVTHSIEEACFFSNRIYLLSDRPAQVLDIYELEKNNEKRKEEYLLDKKELSINRNIRKKLQLNSNNKMNKSFSQNIEKKSKNFSISFFFQLLVLLVVLTIIKYFGKVNDYVFPYPHDILIRFIKTIKSGIIFPHLFTTIYESMTGFLIAFVLTLFLGFVIAKSKKISKILMPYLISFNTLPSVALAPFLVLWFGFGYTPKIIISVIVIFFPMLINNISAIQISDKKMAPLMKFYKTNKWQSFIHFELPESLPIIFSGVKVSITLSVIGAVVGEFITGHVGLGSLVVNAKANFDTELMFVGLLWLIALGLAYYGLANIVYSIIDKKYKSHK